MGVRDRYDYTDAMLHHSLFTQFLKSHGMKTDKKDESTKDVICMDFGFKVRSYEEELKHLNEERKKTGDDEERQKYYDTLEEKIRSRRHLFKEMSKDEIRRVFYEEGVPITYSYTDKKTGEIIEETINYKMLYRNPSKAKVGQCMFIREELYDAARDWLTMGLDKRLPLHGAKIVELSAYAPLTTSAIEGTIHINMDDVLILEDQDSFFRTIADVVKAEDYDTFERVLNPNTKQYDIVPCKKKKCVVERKEVDVKNTIWDGMALIESSSLPDWCNGMALLRNHFFKACAFRTRIQKFIQDYCNENGIDYSTYYIEDIFGVRHLAKNIKMITTDNAIKWKKFADLMGGTLPAAYSYWCERVRENNCLWGIVKTDHVSKLGEVQQMSYQMINTLPCTEDDIYHIAKTSVDYVELLKRDNNEFEKFLRKNATLVNHYEMLADLYAWNHDFENSRMWKTDKRKIINNYVTRLRKGKITVPGDNLTVCGNPYALLLHTVGKDWNNDPTLQPEDGVIQVYTTRFSDGEYLCGIRNPHNSANNLGYFKNVCHPLMEEYFEFSDNIMAVNCIHTDIQARMNGEDFDSDFNFVTNQPEMVKCAKIAYKEYPTVVNEIPESGMTYDNTMSEYARMDSAMQGAQKAIGGSSDSAQLAQSYMWTKVAKREYDAEYWQLYHNTVILAVLAQVAIDGCKKVFSVDASEEIQRIRSQQCMTREKDYPKFMKYTYKIVVTKNGKERPYSEIKKEKSKVKRRIDESLICPMNWLQECLDKIQGINKRNCRETYEYLIPKLDDKTANNRQMGKIRSIIENYDFFVKKFMSTYDEEDEDGILPYIEKTEYVLQVLRGIKMSQLTVYRLIETSLGLERNTPSDRVYRDSSKYTRKMLNMLYRSNTEKFLNCFIKFT